LLVFAHLPLGSVVSAPVGEVKFHSPSPSLRLSKEMANHLAILQSHCIHCFAQACVSALDTGTHLAGRRAEPLGPLLHARAGLSLRLALPGAVQNAKINE
jgi:hypothetical protein